MDQYLIPHSNLGGFGFFVCYLKGTMKFNIFLFLKWNQHLCNHACSWKYMYQHMAGFFFSEIDNFEPTCTRIRTDMKSTFYFVEVKSHFSVRYNSTSLQSHVEVKAVFYCFLEVKKRHLGSRMLAWPQIQVFFAYFMPWKQSNLQWKNTGNCIGPGSYVAFLPCDCNWNKR